MTTKNDIYAAGLEYEARQAEWKQRHGQIHKDISDSHKHMKLTEARKRYNMPDAGWGDIIMSMCSECQKDKKEELTAA